MKKNAGKKVTKSNTKIYDDKVALDSKRVSDEMKAKNGLGTGKNNRFTLSDLASVIPLNENYFRRTYKTEIKTEYAQKVADYFGVDLRYLIGETDFRTCDEVLTYVDMRGREQLKKAIEYFNTLNIKIKLVSINSNGKICPPVISLGEIGIYDKKKYDEIKKSNGETVRNCFSITYYDDVFERRITKHLKISEMLSFVQKIGSVTENTFETFL